MNLDEIPGEIPESKMAKTILEAHPQKLVKVMVHGGERIGKSIWAIKVMWEVYEALGYTEDEAFEEAFGSLFFRPWEFLDKIDELEEAVIEDFTAQAPVLCIDDAGVGLGGGLYDLDRDTFWELKETWPTVGTYVTGLFLTTPEPEDITDTFKGWAYRVKIIEHHEMGEEYGRRALVYSEDTDAIGVHRRARRKGGWKEDFSCFLPNKWFEPYRQRRVKFRSEIKDMREKHADEKE